MLLTIFSLLIAYQFKHFIADSLLQGRYMLGKFKPGWDFIPPLAAHCGVHALFTLMIVLNVKPEYWWLAIVDFVVHFIMDRLKAGPRYMGRWHALSKTEMLAIIKRAVANKLTDKDKEALRNNMLFWHSLMLDQKVHHLTHYFIIFMLVKDLEGPTSGVAFMLAFIMSPLLLCGWLLTSIVIASLVFLFATGLIFFFVRKIRDLR